MISSPPFLARVKLTLDGRLLDAGDLRKRLTTTDKVRAGGSPASRRCRCSSGG